MVNQKFSIKERRQKIKDEANALVLLGILCPTCTYLETEGCRLKNLGVTAEVFKCPKYKVVS